MNKKHVDHTPCSVCESRGISCFKDLAGSAIDNLTEHKSSNIYANKEILFREGSHPLGVFCLKRGKVKVYKIGYDGKEQIVQIAKEGDLLGYRALISEEKYPVTAETIEETEACFIQRTEFIEVLESSKELNNTLLKQACQELGIFTQVLTNQAQMSVRERCAISFYQLYETYGGDGTNTVEVNLTREDLANIVGTATETLIRLIHDFKEEGILESKGRKIMIKEPQKLKQIGHIFK